VLGHPPGGVDGPRRLQHVDEIYIFRVRNGKLTDATRVEDNLNRLRPLDRDG